VETRIREVVLVFAKYILWIALSALIVFILFTGRTSLIAATARFATEGFNEAMQARLLDKVYLIIAGLLGLVGMVATQHYMTNSSGWKNTLFRFAFVCGILLVVLAFFTLVTQASHGDLFTSASSVIVILGPLLAGASLIAISAAKKS
jgi:hypothetical protein